MSDDVRTLELAKTVVQQFASELMDALDSRIYWNRESGNRKVAAALEEVKDSVQSAVEEAL